MRGRPILPPLIELHRMCAERAPHLHWRLSRLLAILEDFPDESWRQVAGRCLDYIGERENVQDGPRTLRTFMERAARDREATATETEPTKPDTWIHCVGCRTYFNATAEVHRRHVLRLQDPVSVSTCETCFTNRETKETDARPDPQNPSEGNRQDRGPGADRRGDDVDDPA